MCTLADKNISWMVQEAAIGQVVDSQGMWNPHCGCQICVTCVCAFAGSIQQLPIMGHWGLLRGRRDDALSLYITGFSDNGFLSRSAMSQGQKNDKLVDVPNWPD